MIMSKEHENYIKEIKKKKVLILLTQISLLILFFFLWEILSKTNIINSFIFSSPSKIIETLIELYKNNNLFHHIYRTLYEVIVSFIICGILSFILSLILYSSKLIRNILDPFIVTINSLPKVAFGPLLIIWLGTSTKTIVVNALLISIIVTTITILNGMLTCNKDYLKLFKIFNATKIDTIKYLIIPSSKSFLISSLKINLSMNLIGLLPPVGEN